MTETDKPICCCEKWRHSFGMAVTFHCPEHGIIREYAFDKALH